MNVYRSFGFVRDNPHFFSQVIETKNAAAFISYSVIEDYFSYDGVYDDNEPDHSVRITMAIFFYYENAGGLLGREQLRIFAFCLV